MNGQTQGHLTDAGLESVPRMVRLPGGSFRMGSEAGRADERPVHEVCLGPFELAMYPVTNTEYGRFLDATGSERPAHWGEPGFREPNCPVCGVSWVDAVRYCEWLNAVMGVESGGWQFHLPSEAQLEYAARGGAHRLAYPWGDEEPSLEGYYERGQAGRLTGRPMPVGTVPWWPTTPPEHIGPAPGPFGLYNLADNVHEWCADYYARDYYTVSERDNPRGPPCSDRRVATAGSWRHDIKFARNAARSSLAPTKRFADFGFRVARSEAFRYVFSEDDPTRELCAAS